MCVEWWDLAVIVAGSLLSGGLGMRWWMRRPKPLKEDRVSGTARYQEYKDG